MQGTQPGWGTATSAHKEAADDASPVPPVNHCPWCQAEEGTCGCYEKFLLRLAEGHQYAQEVARQLVGLGVPVNVTPMEVRRDLADRSRFKGEIDLMVGKRLVDVKSSSRRWTSKYDIPYDPLYVDTVAGWDSKPRKPCAVVVISQQTKVCLVVPVSTRQLWKVVDSFDNDRGFSEPRYACPGRYLRTLREFAVWLLAHQGQPKKLRQEEDDDG